MITKEVTIINPSGLESKPAAMFIQKASIYKSSIWIEKGERKANAKSLLGVLSLGVACGNKVLLTVEGDDEELAVQELAEYISLGLGESIKNG